MKKLNYVIMVNLILISVLLLSLTMSGLSQDKVINWRLQSMCAAGDFGFEGAKRFAEQVTEASGGRLVVKAFTAGAIIPAGKEFDGAISGAVEASHVSGGWAVGYVPAGVFYTNWVGGHTGNQLMMWLEHEGNDLARELYEPIGLYFVDQLTVHPAEVWAHSTKPLRSVEDIKGLKIRCGTTALNSIFQAMGAAPVFLPGGEIYESVKRGVIDAFEYITPSLNWGMGFHEVTDYMYISSSRAPSDAQSLYVNMDVWNALTPDLQEIVKLVAHRVSHEFFTESVVRDSTALEKYKEYGTIVEKLPTDIEELLFEKAIEYYAAESAKDPGYKKVYESALKFKEICDTFGIK
jgi:TRAP-type mannitol/chloroaromatic compound transport system substrate-binding protein